MCTLELTELSSIYQVSREEDSFIWAIARRASILWENHGRYIPTIAFAVAVEQCHANVCRLKLQELLESRNSDFAHDVAGIMHYMVDGKFTDLFWPRFAAY